MAGIKDTFKIINKSVDEIEKVKSDVKKSGLSEETINIIPLGLTLIIWLPKLLLEQKITLFRLKELLFGKSQKTKSKKRQNRDKNKTNNITKDSNSKNRSVNVDEDKSSESEGNKEPAKKKSGRIAQH